MLIAERDKGNVTCSLNHIVFFFFRFKSRTYNLLSLFILNLNLIFILGLEKWCRKVKDNRHGPAPTVVGKRRIAEGSPLLHLDLSKIRARPLPVPLQILVPVLAECLPCCFLESTFPHSLRLHSLLWLCVELF